MSGGDVHRILSSVALLDNRNAVLSLATQSDLDVGEGSAIINFSLPIGVPVPEKPSLPTIPASSALAATPLIGFYFGAKWCPPCRKFSPVLSEFARKNSKEFAVIFCSADRTAKQQQEFLGKKTFLALPFESSARQELLQLYRVSSFPTLIVVDTRTPELKVVTRWGRLAIQGETIPGTLVEKWLSGYSGLFSEKSAKLLLLPVACTLALFFIFSRGI